MQYLDYPIDKIACFAISKYPVFLIIRLKTELKIYYNTYNEGDETFNFL